VVAFALKTALVFISHKKPQLRYLLSALAMLVSLALPFITFSIIHQAETVTFSNFATLAPLFDINITAEQSNTASWTTNVFEYLPYLSLSWLLVVFFLASKLLFEVFMVNQLPKQSTMPANKVLNDRFLTLVSQMQLKIVPRLLISLKTQVPMAIGWLKPVVLLPANMVTGLTNTQLEMLILHELAHIRRHDYLVNFLQTLISILLFFHPGVQWISKQMRNEREYCSDDIAVKHCGNAVAYAHTLADTAALCSKHRQHTIPNMAMAASGGDLKQRVVRLVNHHCTPENETGKWLAATFIIVLVLAIASNQFLTPSLFELGSKILPYQQKEKQASSSPLKTELTKSSLANYLLSNEAPNFLPPETNNRLVNTPFLTDKPANSTLVALTKNQTIMPSRSINQPFIEHKTIENKNPPLKKQESMVDYIKNQDVITHIARTIETEKVASATNKKQSQEKPLLIATQIQKPVKISKNKTTKQRQALTLLAKSTRLGTSKATSETLISSSFIQQPQKVSSDSSIDKKSMPTEVVNLTDSSFTEAAFTQPLLKQVSMNNINGTVNDLYAIENNQFTPHDSLLVALPPSEFKAQLIKAVDPKYPATAKRRGIEIEVKVNFTIDVSGRIKDLDFEHQSKVNYFRSSIKSAMQKWAFEPAKKGGKAIESQMSKIFSFSLQG
jgi:TonB family protein